MQGVRKKLKPVDLKDVSKRKRSELSANLLEGSLSLFLWCCELLSALL
jgi:hypothetical protein